MADDFLTFLNKIQTQYPQAIPILSQPGVMDVYKQAIDGGWSSERLQAALEQTQWWQSTNASSRSFQALLATDPATATQKIEQVKRIIADLEKTLNISLDTSGGLASPGFKFLNDAVQNGWDATEIRYRMLAMTSGATTYGAGDIGATAAQVRKMANDYGLPMSDQRAMEYAKSVLQGALDMESIQGDLILQAKSLYPALAGQLDRGLTVRQFADPYLQLAQRELGIDPNTVDLTDAKWLKMLNQSDPNGNRTPMTIDQWLTVIRTDPTYGYQNSSAGKQSATTLATQLQQKFGAAA